MAVTANANALIASMAELNSYSNLALTDSDTAQILINAASDFIADYTKRTLKSTTYTSEKYDGNGNYKLLLKQYPVTALTSLLRWDTISNAVAYTYAVNTDYLLDADQGIVMLREGLQYGVQNYQITYTAGFTTIPSNIKQACAMYCSWFSNTTKKTTGMKSESMGDYSYTLDKGGSLFNGLAIPAEILSILDKYRRVDIV